jgi:undecaprenyl pyrophosphate phosphatase UppP
MSYHLTYLQAVVTGLVQGVTELFPVSSLGHNVLLPALIGGSWAKTLNVSAPGSPYLAFIVGLHVATAIAMIAFFWRDWLRIVRGFFSSIGQRRVATPDQRLAWMIILGTIPVGIVGLLVQKEFTKVFAKPELAATFLAINGLILLASERMRRRKEDRGGGGTRAAGGPRPAFDGPAGGPGFGSGPPARRPAGGPSAGGPPPGYSQQPRQQQWQGPDPRYGQDDRPQQGGGGRHGRHGRGGQGGQYGPDGQPIRGGQYGPDGQPIRGGQYGPDGQPMRDAQYEQEQYGQEQYGRDGRPGRGAQYGQEQYGQEQYGQEQYGRDPRGGRPEQPSGGPGYGQQAPYGQQPWDGQPGPGQDTWRDQARQQDGDPRGGRDPRELGDPRDPRASRQQQPTGRHGRPGGGRPGDARPGDARPGPNDGGGDPAVAADRRLSTMGYKRAVFIGAAQILALLPGISRDGIVTVAGMGRGLTRQDAVRYSFLLSAPVILAAGALKASDLTGPISKGMHGPIVVGSVIAGLGAYLSIRFLTKYFSEDKSLNPFGYYCIIAGLGSLAYLVLK